MYQIEKITRPVSTEHYFIHLGGDIAALAYNKNDAKAIQEALNEEHELLESFASDLSKLLTSQ